jgi:hypothetical protein
MSVKIKKKFPKLKKTDHLQKGTKGKPKVLDAYADNFLFKVPNA